MYCSPQGWPILTRTGRPGQSLRGSACVCGKKGFFVLKRATEINRRRTRTDADKRLFVSADPRETGYAFHGAGLAETRLLALRAAVTSEHSHQSMNFGINETSPIIDKR